MELIIEAIGAHLRAHEEPNQRFVGIIGIIENIIEKLSQEAENFQQMVNADGLSDLGFFE